MVFLVSETDRSEYLSWPEITDSLEMRPSTSKGLGIGREVSPIRSALGMIVSRNLESRTLTE